MPVPSSDEVDNVCENLRTAIRLHSRRKRRASRSKVELSCGLVCYMPLASIYFLSTDPVEEAKEYRASEIAPILSPRTAATRVGRDLHWSG